MTWHWGTTLVIVGLSWCQCHVNIVNTDVWVRVMLEAPCYVENLEMSSVAWCLGGLVVAFRWDSCVCLFCALYGLLYWVLVAIGLHQPNNKCIMLQLFHTDSHYEVYYLLNLLIFPLLEFPWRLHVCGSISVLAPLIAINLYNWLISKWWFFKQRRKRALDNLG